MLRVVNFETVDSTNNYIKDAIRRGEPAGLLCRASRQTGGYGRQGREWESPHGSLYQSLLLRPDAPGESLPTFALVVALALRDSIVDQLCRACAPAIGAAPDDVDAVGAGTEAADGANAVSAAASQLMVKWPNDLLFSGAKLAGISCENLSGALCLGMGVNVSRPEDPMAVENARPVAFLQDVYETAGQPWNYSEEFLNALGNSIAERVLDYCKIWEQEGFSHFHSAYEKCDFLNGKNVAITHLNRDNVLNGQCVGINEKGNLLLSAANGVQEVFSGEAHVLLS